MIISNCGQMYNSRLSFSGIKVHDSMKSSVIGNALDKALNTDDVPEIEAAKKNTDDADRDVFINKKANHYYLTVKSMSEPDKEIETVPFRNADKNLERTFNYLTRSCGFSPENAAKEWLQGSIDEITYKFDKVKSSNRQELISNSL